MEAPEKIYRTTTYLNSDRGNTKWKKAPVAGADNIEYTRTDAFIKKACKFIREGGMRGNAYIVTEFGEEVIDFLKLAEDFKNYMKGE